MLVSLLHTGLDDEAKNAFQKQQVFSSCFCSMNKKRAVFQIPPDMSPAETGNQITCSDGLFIYIYT